MTLGFRIFPSPARLPKEVIAALAEHAASNLCDSMGRAHDVSSALRPMHRGGKLCGPALTVRTAPGDNLLVHKAIDLAQPGDVIVVDGGGFAGAALIGDIMTSYALTRGVAGFVVVAPAQAEAVLAAVRKLLAKEKALLESIARNNVDRRWVDETLKEKGCTL